MFKKLFGKKTEKKVSAVPPVGKSVGEVTHYYSHLGVAIVKFNQAVQTGVTVRFHGTTTDFEETIGSMQYDHKPVEKAAKGKEVGIKVSEKVREGDRVYLV